MRIGLLSKKSNVPIETIRYYEKEGLLPEPKRAENNYRIYEKRHLERLLFIRNCRAFDMSLEEIKALLEATTLPEESCYSVNEIVTEHIGHIESRIEQLQRLKAHLVAIQARCEQDHTVEECTLVDELNSMEPPITGKKNHLE